MAEGQKAAQETKGIFHELNNASEGLRKNVNSFVDNLAGDKHTTGTTSSTGTTSTGGTTGTMGTTSTMGSTGTTGMGTSTSSTGTGMGNHAETGNSGFSKDAERLGDVLKANTNAAAEKMDQHSAKR